MIVEYTRYKRKGPKRKDEPRAINPKAPLWKGFLLRHPVTQQVIAVSTNKKVLEAKQKQLRASGFLPYGD